MSSPTLSCWGRSKSHSSYNSDTSRSNLKTYSEGNISSKSQSSLNTLEYLERLMGDHTKEINFERESFDSFQKITNFRNWYIW